MLEQGSAGLAQDTACPVPPQARSSTQQRFPNRLLASFRCLSSVRFHWSVGVLSYLPSLAKNASTAAFVGMEACAPRRVTEMAAAADANRAAAHGSLPSSNATAKAPLKQSPAATVSTASTRKGSTHFASPPAVAT